MDSSRWQFYVMPKPPKIKTSRLTYFPIQKHWRKLGPIFRSKEAKAVWEPNMIEFDEQRANDRGCKSSRKSKWERLPMHYDSCDWRFCADGQRGPRPRYWDYVCHRACHWLVDLCLYVAMTAYPKVSWRIVSYDRDGNGNSHSTVWNGDCENPVLFDANFMALGVRAKDAWKTASKGRMLKPGKWLRPWCSQGT